MSPPSTTASPPTTSDGASDSDQVGSSLGVFWTMLRLGCIAFGGPVAHLALFQQELVERRRWIAQDRFADLIAFCQFLPGPASSQVGMGLGLHRAGLRGMLAAWLGFTLPTAVLLVALAFGIGAVGEALGHGWLRGLHAAVVAIVAWAVWSMAQKLCPDRLRGGIALAAAVLMLAAPVPAMQFVVIAVGAVAGLLLLRGRVEVPAEAPVAQRPGRRLALVGGLTAAIVAAVLIGATVAPHQLWNVFIAFFRVGFLVFGGGHVVLPMLEAEVVDPGWLSQQQFLTGYALTQAMPGPIFTLSAYLGAAMSAGWMALAYAGVALVGIFGPSFLLVAGLLPVWERLRGVRLARAALAGIAAAVVGLLLAALFVPIAQSALAAPVPHIDTAVAIGAFALLTIGKWPAWSVVIAAALIGAVLDLIGVPGYRA